jgi:serine/threonine-protein kinase RsbW
VTVDKIIYRITLPTNQRSIGRIEKFLAKVDKHVRLNEIQMHKVIVSLTEAVNNALIHGNKMNPVKKVTVISEILPGWLLFIVNDQGHGFKPEKVANPLKEENLLRESGRGIFLMRTLMDRVEFERIKGGYQVRLWLDLMK